MFHKSVLIKSKNINTETHFQSFQRLNNQYWRQIIISTNNSAIWRREAIKGGPEKLNPKG